MSCVNHPDQVVGTVQCDECRREFCLDCARPVGGYHYCDACRKEIEGDTVKVGEMRHELAPIWKRSAAFVVDVAATVLPTAGIFVMLFMSDFQRRLDAPAPERAVSHALIFVLMASGFWLLYEVVMLCWRGQTVGKIALGIKVVTPEGKDSTPKQIMIRAAVRAGVHGTFCLGPYVGIIAFAADYVLAFMGADRTALHDRVAETRVVDWHG
jgi:uncharacterized RDD family membrane protein YckC